MIVLGMVVKLFPPKGEGIAAIREILLTKINFDTFLPSNTLCCKFTYFDMKMVQKLLAYPTDMV